jgi:hypothetical protein
MGTEPAPEGVALSERRPVVFGPLPAPASDGRRLLLTEGQPMTYRGNSIRMSLAAAAAALILGCGWPQAGMAQNRNLPDGPIPCTDFQRGADGSWTVMHPTTIRPQGVAMNLQPGQTFAKNQSLDGIEITTVLDRHCGN